MIFNNVSVVGLGYIGLPTAAILASRGINVIGVDINPRVVAAVNKGNVHIVEPDLEALVRVAVADGKLRARTKAEFADAFIIAVPTPLKENHKPDLSYIHAAAKMLAPVLQENNLVILESTSPVGTTEQLMKWLREENPNLSNIYLCYCPERVMPGHIMQELINNDRIIGGVSLEASEKAVSLYKNFVEGECLVTNVRTAELSKLTENAFRDVNIAFANELSLVCDDLGIDVWELIAMVNRHPRVNMLQPGPGVGGHCIAVDPWFIIDSVPNKTRLIQAARDVNDYKSVYVVNKICDKIKDLENPVIACLGLAFKKNIDDLRESPAVKIVKYLYEKKVGKLLVVEPNIDVLPRELENIIELVKLEEIFSRANVVVLLVDHNEFNVIDFSLLRGKIVIDTQGFWR